MARDRELRISGRLVTPEAGRLLVQYAIGGIVLTVLASVGGGLLGVVFNPFVLVLVTMGVAVTLWLVVVIEDWAPPQTWEDVRYPTSSLHVGSDNRTRRLASLLLSSDDVHRMSQRQLRDLMRELTVARLVRSHEADPADPLSSPLLSRGLRSYLSRPDHAVPPLTKRTLHAYLEEISRL